VKIQQKPLKISSSLIFLGMFFVVANTCADIVAYRMATLGPLFFGVGVFIVPLTYTCSDIVAEIYGYEVAKKIIWLGILNEGLFNIICYFLNLFPPPPDLHNQFIYINVLSHLPRIYFGVLLANIVSIFLNIYCISKWKVLLRGKYFWLRSLASSSIGEVTFTIICNIIVFIGTMPNSQMLRLIISNFSLKAACAVILAYPATIVVNILRKHEKINIYDYNINYNPFSM
jgi:queuosine precursor transporter